MHAGALLLAVWQVHRRQPAGASEMTVESAPALVLVSIRPVSDSRALPGAAVGVPGFHAARRASRPTARAPTGRTADVVDWDANRQRAIAGTLAEAAAAAAINAHRSMKDASGRMPESPVAVARERPFSWSPEPHTLFRKNRVGNVSVGGDGLIITLGDDRCFIADLVAFGCRIGKKPKPNGDLFTNMRAHLDARVNDPLP